MLRTKKSVCREKCVEHMRRAGIPVSLLMDQRKRGRYLGWYYDAAGDSYWMLRVFIDANGKENILARAFIGQYNDYENLPIDKIRVTC